MICSDLVPLQRTSVDELALGMQVVESAEKVLEASFQERVRKAPGRVPQEKVPPAVPHRPLDQAIMFLLRPVGRW